MRIFKNENEFVCTTKEVSDDFKKRHSDILLKLEGKLRKDGKKEIGLIEEIESTGFPAHLYFIKNIAINEQNKQEYKEYLLTKRGFNLLVMGFTGAEAIQWKIRYIDEFEKLEKEIEELKIQNEKLQTEIKEKELSNVKAASMLLSHKDKLGLTKGYLYPVLIELGVTEKNKFKAHNLIKQLLLGKYENVKKDKEFNTSQFIQDYKSLAEKLKEESHVYFPDKNQVSFFDDILN